MIKDTRKRAFVMNLQTHAEPTPPTDPEPPKHDPEPPENDPEPTPPTEPKPKAPKTFTQEEVNRIATTEKKQGRQAILKELGITEEQAKAMAAVLNSNNQDPTPPPAQNNELAEMQQRLIMSEIRSELALEGVKSGAADDMGKLVLSELDITSYTPEDIATVVKDVKTRHQGSFSGIAEQRGTGSNYRGVDTDNVLSKRDGSFGKSLASQLKGNK